MTFKMTKKNVLPALVLEIYHFETLSGFQVATRYSPLLCIVKCSLASNVLPDTGISSVYNLSSIFTIHEHIDIGHIAGLESTARGFTSGKMHHLLLYTDMLFSHRPFRTVMLLLLFFFLEAREN